MIGEIRVTLLPYFDMSRNAKLNKKRPALIIAKADAEDYVILPISSITRQENRDPVYDIEIEPAKYPLLNLQKKSYVRTHKQTIVHCKEISDKIGDIKKDYPDLYLAIIEKRQEFSDKITEQAI